MGTGYRTLLAAASASIEEKKSEFIATASPAATEAEALALLEAVRAQHRTANHNVYAYVLSEGARQRYSDDGEPAKTAGLPVLDVIQHAGLRDVIVVVTRYFGGTLLGTGGLVRAYTAAAQAALEAAEIVTMRLCADVRVTLPYALYESAMRLAAQAGARCASPAFEAEVSLAITLPEEDAPALVEGLRELSRGAAQPKVSEPYYTPFAAGEDAEDER